MIRRKARLLDVAYIHDKDTHKTYIKLFLKGKKTGKRKHLFLEIYPYFLVSTNVSEEALQKAVEDVSNELSIKCWLGEKVDRYFGGERRELYKVYVEAPPRVPKVKHFIKEKINCETYEYDIPFKRRFIIDEQLTPLDYVIYEREGKRVTKIQGMDEATERLSFASFDIETYNPKGIPDPKEDAVIIITYNDNKSLEFLSTKGKSTRPVDDEKSLLKVFDALIEERSPDLLVGYNSSTFDLPYIQERAKQLRVKMKLFEKARKVHHGLVSGYHLQNIIHWDLYPTVRLFSTMGVIRAERLTLAEVYKAVFGKEKLMINRADIWEMWDNNDIRVMQEYAEMDATSTYVIADELLPLEVEIAKLAKLPFFEASLATSGQLVENMLMFYAGSEKHIIPTKPRESEIARRFANPIEGAYVKLPEPGIYSNIAVVDFRGMYPSIIVSYNVDPYTLTKEDAGAVYTSPKGHAFVEKPRGLIPNVLGRLVDLRARLKKKLKEFEDKKSDEYKRLKARVRALKILSNSFYGYLGYARSRWYCRECAESITAWARHHIKETERKAEERGFKVLYIDTDSLFLLMGDKNKDNVYSFLEEINKELPGKMELELEDFYTRALFVSKRKGGKGAKKKYAMISEKGEIKIKGFELVRRDWAMVARETQKAVLEAILKKGSKEEAIKIVTDIVDKIRKGKLPLEEMVIYTQIKKGLDDYESTSPEVMAAKRLQEARGIPMGAGSMVGYVITKKGKSISDKAWPLELAKDYDPEYYINNQVLPAVMKILKELGIREEQLKDGLKQNTLSKFF